MEGQSAAPHSDDRSADGPPTRVPATELSIAVGRARASGLRLLHPTVSREHAIVERVGASHVVRDLDSRYGTYVNGVRISAKALLRDDVVRFGTATSYRYLGDCFEYVHHATGYTIALQDVGCTKNGKTLLSGVTLEMPADVLVGILGPSGAGKSTLLSVLASYRSPTSGKVIFDGHLNLQDWRGEYRSNLGNVPQDDVLFSGLSARENLRYSARLRFGPDTPCREVEERVAKALGQVAIDRQADWPTLIESLSGGERKRVSVALELLVRPRLLLLDEPTSGLDPGAEARLIELLKVIALQGTTVICTTHQMDNIHLFDLIVVVGLKNKEGRLAYFGEPDRFLHYLGSNSYADAFDRLARGEFTPLPSGPPDSCPEPTVGGRGLASPISPRAGRRVASAAGPGVGPQVLAVATRSLHRVVRDRALVSTMVAQPVALGALLAATQFMEGGTRLLNFFICVVSVWLGLNNSARDLVRERRNFVREQLAGLNADAYLLAKVAVFGCVGVAQTSLLLGITSVFAWCAMDSSVAAEFVLGESPVFHLLGTMACLLVSYLCGLGLGLLASTLASSEEAAVAALPLLIMPQLLVSAVTVGCVHEPYNHPRPFKPIVLAFSGESPVEDPVGRILDAVSLLCFSRPSSLALDEGNPYWLGDCLHLILLLLLTWGGVWVAFGVMEKKWPRALRLA